MVSLFPLYVTYITVNTQLVAVTYDLPVAFVLDNHGTVMSAGELKGGTGDIPSDLINDPFQTGSNRLYITITPVDHTSKTRP